VSRFGYGDSMGSSILENTKLATTNLEKPYKQRIKVLKESYTLI
jgi:hypothetical protein